MKIYLYYLTRYIVNRYLYIMLYTGEIQYIQYLHKKVNKSFVVYIYIDEIPITLFNLLFKLKMVYTQNASIFLFFPSKHQY